MLREKTRKIFLTTEVPLPQWESVIERLGAANPRFSITYIKRVQATNFSYYCYVILEDTKHEVEICTMIESFLQENVPVVKIHWQKT